MYKIGASDNKRRKSKTRRLLKKFEDAVRDRVIAVLKGPDFPIALEQAEAEYQYARKALLHHIDES